MYVGILYNRKHLASVMEGTLRHEKPELYATAAAELALTPCFFTLHDVDWRKQTVRARLLGADGSWVVESLPIPRVIHNRAMYSHKRSRRTLQHLAQRPQIKMFNRCNRLNKYAVYHALCNHRGLQAHLPETRRLTDFWLDRFLRRFSTVLIKPDYGNIGQGIYRLKHKGGGVVLASGTGEGCEHFEDRRKLYRRLRRVLSPLRSYHIQEGIPLAEYEGKPFDIRVSLQKNETGTWQVTGMVAKAAREGSFVTNLGRGGKAMPADEALAAALPHLSLQKVKESVRNLALVCGHALEKSCSMFADLGLDIGLDKHGKPFLIEINGRDLRYSFAEAGEREIWQKTFAMPMRYASYLLQTQREEG